MKKIVAIFIMFVLCFSVTACVGENKKAFELSKVAYGNVKAAYEITEQYSTDLYEAWRLGIFDKEELYNDGVTYLATKLSLSEDELKEGLVYAIEKKTGGKLSDNDRADFVDVDNKYVFKVMGDNSSLFSFCVSIVEGAYIANGKTEKAQVALNNAKTQMKELSESYSDYEHYPNLKGYYTTTSSFFDFCQNPDASFDQIKDTINNYKKEARDFENDLDFIFED